ncbi:hypothetical protein pdam_00025700 [Pocillopora damicornis]|uniref:Uncharacterized protein n=1 Tax=Pocillopora damicornis TaxID=46731 RepID=A0A3M6U2T5_POCDA|nr:hypothetical protein pdam_00025700 [Pocillopora damicornis]
MYGSSVWVSTSVDNSNKYLNGVCPDYMLELLRRNIGMRATERQSVDSVVDLCENDEEAEPTNTWLAVEKDEEKEDQPNLCFLKEAISPKTFHHIKRSIENDQDPMFKLFIPLLLLYKKTTAIN